MCCLINAFQKDCTCRLPWEMAVFSQTGNYADKPPLKVTLCSPPVCSETVRAKVFKEKTVMAECASLFLAGVARKATVTTI